MGSRSPVTTTICIMEGEDESQDDFPCTLLSMITSNLEEERDEPASVSHDGSWNTKPRTRNMHHHCQPSSRMKGKEEWESYWELGMVCKRETGPGPVLVSFGFRGGWETKARHCEWATTFGSCPPLPLVRLNTFSLYCSPMNKLSFKPKYMHMTLNRNELGKRCLTLIKFLQSAKTEHGTKAIPIDHSNYVLRRVLTKTTQLLCPT